MTTNLPCRTAPDLFQAPDGQRSDTAPYKRRVAAAKALCARCPILLACRDEGRELRATGVWGGEDEPERESAGYKPMKARVPSPCGTEAGARRHWRDGESACPPCARAASTAKKEREAKHARKPLTTAA